MMEYTVNSYRTLLNWEEMPPARIELYPDKKEKDKLLAMHVSLKHKTIKISDLLDKSLSALPLPAEIIIRIQDKLIGTNVSYVIRGIDGYLALLGEENKKQFHIAMRKILDDQKLYVVFPMNCYSFKQHSFLNPKYENSLQIIRIVGAGDMDSISKQLQLRINVYPEQFLPQRTGISSFKALLEHLEQNTDSNEYNVTLSAAAAKQAGLSDSVHFVTSAHETASLYYSVELPLDDLLIGDLLTECHVQNITPKEYIERLFGQTNFSKKNGLKRLYHLRSHKYWMAFVWLLKQRIDVDSYLLKVLNNLTNPDDLLHEYIVDAAVASVLKNDKNIDSYAAERKESLHSLGISFEPLIIEFINSVKDYNNALPFLNCGTATEHCEIVRRAGELDLISGLPAEYGTLCPELHDYLSDVSCGNSTLDDYFKMYRRNSIKNEVSEGFADSAFKNSVHIQSVKMRDSLLSEQSVQDKTALLIVDGMGAEYLPFLVSAAKRLGITVSFYDIAEVRLPSSTEYNRITWEKESLLHRHHNVDNIAHNGASKNEKCTPERNLYATLAEIETEIFKQIKNGLSKFSQVIVTSDHGTSRLAVTAYNSGLCETLPWKGEPDDWRYSLAIGNSSAPDKMESSYNPSGNNTYWVVRGYNRLPKKGSKPYALHGGATPEERFVPFIIFNAAKAAAIVQMQTKRSAEQIIEKDDFDI